MQKDRATGSAMDPRDALEVLTTPPSTNGRCAVCALPVGWLTTDARTAHAHFHDAVAALARAVLGGAA